jgi:chemotaxis protein MotB
MIRRKPIQDEEENPDRWLVSYADFITLLFAFFVVMYAISTVNKSKYQHLSSSIGMALSGSSNQEKQQRLNAAKQPQTTIIKPLPLNYILQKNRRKEIETMAQMSAELTNTFSTLITDKSLTIAQDDQGVRIDINDSLLFNEGSAELRQEAKSIIEQIGEKLKEQTRLIQVEGHTDNIDIHNAEFFSNWELSALRASSVVRMLSANGIAEQRLSAIGFGSTQPIESNMTELGRAKNRRVSIIILYNKIVSKEVVAEQEPH